MMVDSKTARIRFNIATGTKGPVMNGSHISTTCGERVIAAIEAGHTREEVAELFTWL